MVVTQIIQRTYTRPEFFTLEIIRRPQPVVARSITLISPEGGSINYHLANEEALNIDTARSVMNKKNIITFSMNTLQKIDDIDVYPEPERWLAAVYVSFPPEGTSSYSWERVGDHYLSALEDAYAGMARLNESARKIEPGPPDSLMARIALLVRSKLRYHGNFEGIHGIVPHTITSILENGYGDCKDMCIVGQSIARLLKVPAGLMLVKAGDGFQACPTVPSLGIFNHVMLFYERPDGTRIVVDPTMSYGDPLESGFLFAGKKVLFLKEHGSFFDTVQRPPTFYNTVTTQSTITMDPKESTWKLDGTVALCGYVAMKLYPVFRELSSEQMMPVIKKYLRHFFEIDATTAALNRCNADTIVLQYSASFQENYLEVAGGGFLLNKPSVFGGDVRFTTLTYPGPCFFQEIEQNDTWIVPKKYKNLEKADFKAAVAQGAWSIGRNTVTRNYMQQHCIVNDDEAHKFTVMKNEFLKATVWKQ